MIRDSWWSYYLQRYLNLPLEDYLRRLTHLANHSKISIGCSLRIDSRSPLPILCTRSLVSIRMMVRPSAIVRIECPTSSLQDYRRTMCPFLEGRIRFLDQNTPTLMDISKWVEFTFGWFQNYPYTEVNSFSEDQILSELCNYFDAWHEIIGEENWKGDDGCLFRTATQFRVILKRFDQIYQAARSSSPSSEPISKDRFREVLYPWKISFSQIETYSMPTMDQVRPLGSFWTLGSTML